MRPLLLAAALLLAAPNFATSQPRGFGGGFRTGPPPPRSTPAGNFRIVQAPPPGLRPPFAPAFGPVFYPDYGWGGGVGGYGYYDGTLGGFGPKYVLPEPRPVPVVPDAPVGPSTALAVSGQLPATLVVQYPAAARVWLDGVEVPGATDTDWTLTSKALRPGETATFRVRGRWEAGGKVYEAVREVPLTAGARSRLIVVSGTEVRE